MSDSDAPARARLPEPALPRADGGEPVALRAHRRGTVLVLLGGPAGAEDRAYLGRLAAAEPSLAGWDGRVLVVVPDAAAAPGGPFPVLVDAAGAVARAVGVTPPALVVADQWGEVHAAAEARSDRPWLAPADLEQWLRFLAIRCAG